MNPTTKGKIAAGVTVFAGVLGALYVGLSLYTGTWNPRKWKSGSNA